MKVIIFASCLLLTGCVTTSKAPQGLTENCFCGTITDGSQAICAVWDQEDDLQRSQMLLGSNPGTCNQQACQKLTTGVCRRWTSWSHLNPKYTSLDIKSPCYCDELVIAFGDEIIRVCAAWQDGDSHLLEYYAIEPCQPSRCQQEPFYKAPQYCTLGFQPFYARTEAQP
ncbi:hypothetical protein [Pseudobacteriovorax antillogorgiicola]|uniref:Lipoprotein n=1 Tax=Pseudobacteriovorax antillogorgiicola TaxID=1513793 RepID=A0A1Y6BKN1_9BACT|nr:hypothetical protein [Pseudobacteriovorax antillogorgiicola]TCS55285.1 hypothetical protein EDD56_1056 [Pseudobacteriovorax antillogorgiicola]SMF14783.1 hypothetical protein SAMN06296036_105318 [Pseudobacteriovorax antillogorgiicola]